ncbi:MAG: DNA alkylation repair protein [Myxococcota bacterium]
MTPQAWQKQLRAAFEPLANAKKAGEMQAYMKSSLPYYGLPLKDGRRMMKELAKPLTFASFSEFDAFVRHVYATAKFREEKYAALSLLDLKQTRPFQTLEAVPLYEWLIVTGAWWDLVDEVATHRFEPLLEREPAAIKRVLLGWSKGGDLWLRRTAIICQVLRHEHTDLELLFATIEPAIGEKDFFLRKAIGWGLRAAGRWKPKEVRAWLTKNGERLAGLSRREAEKAFA